jgi:SAM-dependent methyltransferase
MTDTDFVKDVPVRLGTTEEIAGVVEALQSANFDEKTICDLLKIDTMSRVGPVREHDMDFNAISPQLKLFLDLFLFQQLLPRPEVESALDEATLQHFLSLGLLGVGEFGADQFYSRVLLYPVGGFLIASDRYSNPDGSEFVAPADIVFPAIYAGTLRFLELLPRAEGEDAIDIGSGSGIGAFVLSRSNRRVVAADITERATRFAEFNRALNNLTNVEVICSDLYKAVAGRTFDHIVTHPPYVPSLHVAAIWRDGGTTGESLVRRIIPGIPQHLRPGGTVCIQTLGLDTNEGNFEQRVRGWLASAADEFDIIFATKNERTLAEVLRDLSERDPSLTPDSLKRLHEAFQGAGVIRLPYGALVARRHAPGRPRDPWTARVQQSDATDATDFAAAFALHDRLGDPGFMEQLADLKPRLAPRLEVKVTHVVYEGDLVPAEYLFETDRPFSAIARLDRWMVPLFTRCNGSLTPEQIFAVASEHNELPEGFTLADFLQLLVRMVERGYLVLPDTEP